MKRIVLAACALAAFSGSAEATTYFVDQTIGSINLTGTIDTDGTIGALAASDITSYSLDFAAHGESYNLNPSNGMIFLNAPILVASSTALTFDLSLPGQFGLSRDNQPQHGGDPAPAICVNNSPFGTCYGSPVGPQFSLLIQVVNDPASPNQFNLETRRETPTSIITFATAPGTGSPSAVPETAAWMMMIGGFGMIGGMMRRRRTATRVSFG